MYHMRSFVNCFRYPKFYYPYLLKGLSSLDRSPQILTRSHLHEQSKLKPAKIKIIFVRPDGKRTIVNSEPGKSLYDVVIDTNLDLDGFGSCEGTLCCTTCHLIFNEKDYKKLEEFKKPEEEELNMLDLAEGLCDTSRLGCQVILPEGIDSLEVHIPRLG